MSREHVSRPLSQQPLPAICLLAVIAVSVALAAWQVGASHHPARWLGAATVRPAAASMPTADISPAAVEERHVNVPLETLFVASQGDAAAARCLVASYNLLFAANGVPPVELFVLASPPGATDADLALAAQQLNAQLAASQSTPATVAVPLTVDASPCGS